MCGKYKKYFILLFLLSAIRIAWSKDNLRLGDAAFESGDFNKAIEHYREAIEHKESAALYTNLGHAHARLGQWEMAVEAYQSALKLQEDSPTSEVLRFLAQAQYMNNQFDRASVNFQKAYSLEPDKDDRLWITRCFIQTNQPSRAENVVLDYLNSYPEDIEALELLSYIFQQNDKPNEAIRIHKELVKRHPAQMHLLLGLAKAQTTGKDYQGAIETLEFSLYVTDERNEEALRLLADLYINEGMYRNAAACYSRLISLAESASIEDYYRVGYAYFQTKEFSSAQEAFEKMRQIAPSDIRANLYLGRIAEQRAKADKAREYYLAAIRSSPSSLEPRLALGNLELENRFFGQAAEQIAKAIELGDRRVEIYYNYVLALMSESKYDKATVALKEAFRNYPLNEELNSLLYRLSKEVSEKTKYQKDIDELLNKKF